MSHLISQWRQRVEEVQNELQTFKDETSAIQRQREELKRERNTFATSSKEEKMKYQTEMKSLESLAATTGEQTAQASTRKIEADRITGAAATEYSLDLVQLMNEVKAAEHSLSTREIPAEALERESELWCSEEESLRERMYSVEKEIVDARKAASTALTSAEEEARRAEAELHTARMERDADEGTGAYAFPEGVVDQYPDLFVAVYDNHGDGKIRKGRCGSSGKQLSRRAISKAGSKSGGNNNNNNNSNRNSVQPLGQRHANQQQQVDED